ncbi:MAG TPA: MFS transporter [Polyangiaceae bacterium]|nr:MFS transporter [Polyangiaceae bacterium]
MKALSESRRVRYAAFAALYAVQGIPTGFITMAIFAWLAQRGVSTGAIGTLSAIAGLPWAIKILWGPLVDRHQYLPMGRRRAWILSAQVLLLTSASCLLFIEDGPSQLTLLSWLLFLQVLCSSLQDVAIDALAIDVFPMHELGRANAFMTAGQIGGLAIGAAGLSQLIARFGFRSAVIAEVAAIAVLMCFPLLLRERPGERRLPWSSGGAVVAPTPTQTQSFGHLLRRVLVAVTTRSSLVYVAGILLAVTTNKLAQTIFKVHAVQELGWLDVELTQFVGVYGALVGLAGAALAGTLADRLGHVRLLTCVVLALAASSLAFALVAEHWLRPAVVGVYLLFNTALLAMAVVTINALAMDLCTPAIAASQYAVYMAVFNIANVSGDALAGAARALFSVPAFFVVLAGVNAVAAALVRYVDPIAARRALGQKGLPPDAHDVSASTVAPP